MNNANDNANANATVTTTKKSATAKRGRGRRTLKDLCEEHFGAKGKKMFAALADKIGSVSTIKDTCSKFAEVTGLSSPCSIKMRELLRAGIKMGAVRKGSPLHVVANIGRGRPALAEVQAEA